MFKSIHDLENPAFNVDKHVLYETMPFYQDFYVVIKLKRVNVPKFAHFAQGETVYRPFRINDRELRDYNIMKAVIETFGNGDIKKRSDYRIKYQIAKLIDGNLCMYIEKQHSWDHFVSTGVIIVYCENLQALRSYCQRFSLTERKRVGRFQLG